MMPEFDRLLIEAADMLGYLEQDRILLTIALEQIDQESDDLESRLSILLKQFDASLSGYLDHLAYVIEKLLELANHVCEEKSHE